MYLGSAVTDKNDISQEIEGIITLASMVSIGNLLAETSLVRRNSGSASPLYFLCRCRGMESVEMGCRGLEGI